MSDLDLNLEQDQAPKRELRPIAAGIASGLGVGSGSLVGSRELAEVILGEDRVEEVKAVVESSNNSAEPYDVDIFMLYEGPYIFGAVMSVLAYRAASRYVRERLSRKEV